MPKRQNGQWHRATSLMNFQFWCSSQAWTDVYSSVLSGTGCCRRTEKLYEVVRHWGDGTIQVP